MCLLLLPWAVHADVQLAFRDSVLLMNGEYRLGDVASVQAADAALAGRLSDLVLGSAPRPGQSVTVSQFAVNARLERVMAGISAQIRWHGEPVLRVRGGGVEHDGAALTAVARPALLAWLRAQVGDEVEIGIERVGTASPIYLPSGKPGLVARLSESARLRSRMPVWIDISVGGRPHGTVPVWFAVSAYTDVAVANQDLPRHSAVSAAQVIYELRDIAGLTATPVFDELPDEHRLTRAVAAGDIIVSTVLEPIPQVQTGELITVHARHGSVALDVKARALSDGGLHEQILVESLSSQAAYRATVSGKGQATVE